MSGPVHHFVEARGVRLHLAEWPGEATATPLVVLHGFTGSVEAMAPAARAQAGARPVWAVDLVGHGRSESPESPAAYAMQACVDQVVEALHLAGVGRAHWLGYSMGGRTALTAAVRHPAAVERLVLVGASPGIEDGADRAQRVRDDEALAERLLAGGLEAFVDAWMALPLFASQRRLGPAALAEARAQRLGGDARGWAGSLRGMGTGAMPPLHAQLEKVDAPTLLVVGEEDAKFRALAEGLAPRLRTAEIAVIPAAGHAPHLESPATFAAIVRRFLGSPGSGASRENPAL